MHPVMTMLDQVSSLVQQALDDFDKPGVTLTSQVRQAIRIATLRNDFPNLWWLELEMETLDTKSDAPTRSADLRSHFDGDEYSELLERELLAYLARRKWPIMSSSGLPDYEKPSKASMTRSIAELEATLQRFPDQIRDAVPPQGMEGYDLYRREQQLSKLRLAMSANEMLIRKIVEAVRQRVYQFLVDTEHALVYGQVNADIFERNRRYVDERLLVIAPDVLEKFAAAYRRLAEDDTEARSQALTSCRRILKSLADQLYPATHLPALGSDGKEHKVTDERFIARLRQYAYEQVGGRSAGKVVLAEVERLGVLLDRLNSLDSKGVHDDVSQAEVEQCTIQTYLVVGDLLRLSDKRSAVLTE